MAEGAKQDVHLWKETVLFYLIMDLQQGNYDRFKLFSKILQLFNAMWAVSLPPICFWHAKKDVIYA